MVLKLIRKGRERIGEMFSSALFGPLPLECFDEEPKRLAKTGKTLSNASGSYIGRIEGYVRTFNATPPLHDSAKQERYKSFFTTRIANATRIFNEKVQQEHLLPTELVHGEHAWSPHQRAHYARWVSATATFEIADQMKPELPDFMKQEVQEMIRQTLRDGITRSERISPEHIDANWVNQLIDDINRFNLPKQELFDRLKNYINAPQRSYYQTRKRH